MNKLIGHLAIVLVTVGLTGCGLKGPLYYPSKGQQKTTTVQQNTPQSHDASVTPAAPAENQKKK